ncbi:MAG: TIR domain-containing protein [Pseudonocardiaceae bacterium]
MSLPKIFLSYRRDDTSGHTGRLYDTLSARFGSGRIFMDVDALEPGVDFAQRIVEVIEECQVQLVVIGPTWLTMTDRDGARRLDNPRDFVRMEIETALVHDIRVIPVLIRDTTMPSTEELPDSLAGLAHRNAVELDDTRWRRDVDRLVGFLETVPGAEPAEGRGRVVSCVWRRVRSQRPARQALLASGAVLVTIAAGAGLAIVILRWAGGADFTALLNQQLAFVSDRAGGGREMWSMRADGSDLLRLTFDGMDVRKADWSPDGTRLAFPSDRDGDFDIWIMHADGSGLRQLTDDQDVESAPEWSPDGRRIAFGSERGGADSEIWVSNVDGTGLRQLTDNGSDDDTPDWSRSGRIAFENNSDGDYEIYTMDEDGGDVVQITRNTTQDFFPDWSPDGEHLAFRGDADGDYEIYTVDADGSNLRQLTSNDATEHRPAWSADGAFVVFESDLGGNLDLYATTTDGGELRRLTDDPADDSSPAVRPVGG